ncbi:MAG: biotin/lipoyl-containing protein, partial [Phycisphaerales bacterium]
MPRLSDTMEQGTVVKWHVKVGDKVTSGQVIADIETDKATMEQAVFDDGLIARLVCPEGKQVKVGEVIAVLAEEGESMDAAAVAPATAGPASSPPAARPAAQPAASAGSPAPAREIVADVEAVEVGERMRVSPVARRMAEELGVDLAQVKGSGPGGRVIKRDIVLAAENRSSAARPAAAPAAVASAGALVHGAQSIEVPVSNMRGVIAKRLVESKQQIPHY